MSAIDPHLYGAFIAAVVLICVIPGPDMVFVVAAAVRHGPRAGVVAALGMQGGMAVHTAAAVAGLSALVASSAPAFEALRIVGAGYLVWLAVGALRAGNARPAGGSSVVRRADRLARVWRQAAMTNLLNPKIVVFFVAFVPQFVAWERGAVALQLAVLGGTFMIIGLAVDVGVALLAARARRGLSRSRTASRLLERLGATIYLALAARLLTDR